ncbi:MAG TPA: hypothetical protein VGJ48_17750 [Pyrinomonadaceae bacterium]|jgi:hypothetical protein
MLAQVVNVTARSNSIWCYQHHDPKSPEREVGLANRTAVDAKELISVLNDPTSATTRLLTVWSNVPLLLMLDVDWERGPLVLIGLEDYMMWPLLPPGTLLQLDPKVRKIADGAWSEFERPIYLIEHNNRFYCSHAQRKRQTLLLISHAESPSPPSTPIPFREARIRGRLAPIFRPLAVRGSAPGRGSQPRQSLKP